MAGSALCSGSIHQLLLSLDEAFERELFDAVDAEDRSGGGLGDLLMDG